MERLLNSYNGKIYLSVDKDNFRAIQLYTLFDFVEINRNDQMVYMERKVNDKSN